MQSVIVAGVWEIRRSCWSPWASNTVISRVIHMSSDGRGKMVSACGDLGEGGAGSAGGKQMHDHTGQNTRRRLRGAPWTAAGRPERDFSLTATDGVCEEYGCGRVTGNNVFYVLVFGHAFCPDMQSYRKIRGATFEGRDLRDKKN